MLRHLSVRYDPVQDRLVLRLTVADAAGGPDVEHWLQVTRRLVAGWRRDLQTMVDMSAGLPDHLDRTAKAVVSSANHQVMSSQVARRTEPAPPPEAMAEIEPHLVTRISCGLRKSDQKWIVRFERLKHPTLALTMATPTMHALVDAVTRRVRLAEWGLPELPVDRALPEAAASSGTPLH